MADAKLIVVDAPNDWLDIDHNRYAQIAQMIPQSAARPILAFVRADGRHGDTGYAYRRGRFGQAATVDTGWITNEVNSDTYKKIRTSGYSPLAHELAHILGNSGHVIGDEKNLLGNSPVTVNNHITKEQCETFKRHPSITPL
ncbi:hypothetical protein [Bdellovibrio sp. ArHS]|uniref:hypothetical protein n=1 Tax=Bdellovibrio sp. ArHS TaxID=1569284 RepID=UPI0025C7380B|nr:hypothetical protein [Bdellovibrio sp. ArHS]